MLAFKSSINFFVYLLLKSDFRQQFLELFCCLKSKDAKRYPNYDVSIYPSTAQSGRNNIVLTTPIYINSANKKQNQTSFSNKTVISVKTFGT